MDITRSRWGRFRPYILIVSAPLLLSSVALFSMPDLGSTTAQWRGRAQDYLGVSVDRLAHWLDTGRFTHLPPAA